MELSVGIHRVITIRYQMWNAAGELLLDTTDGEPVTFLYGSGEMLPHLEQPLAGLMRGEKKTFSLSDTEAPGLGDRYTFDVQIEAIEWDAKHQSINKGSSTDACGPACECHL